MITTATLFLLRFHIAAASFCATDSSGNPTGSGAGCQTGLPQVGATSTQLDDILKIVFGVVGALAVLFIVIGGLRFVVSDGDPQDTARARNTIIYALIGLLIAIAAEAIVSFALGKVQ